MFVHRITNLLGDLGGPWMPESLARNYLLNPGREQVIRLLAQNHEDDVYIRMNFSGGFSVVSNTNKERLPSPGGQQLGLGPGRGQETLPHKHIDLSGGS